MTKLFRKKYTVTGHDLADGVLTFFRHLLTVMLLWFRIPLMWLLSILSSLSFFAWIFILLVADGTGSHDRAMTWGMFITSVGSFGLMYVYDTLVNFISPDGLIVEA